LAEVAAAPAGRSLRIYRRFSERLGWRRVAAGAEWLRAWVKSGAGGDSLRQSWMVADDGPPRDG